MLDERVRNRPRRRTHPSRSRRTSSGWIPRRCCARTWRTSSTRPGPVAMCGSAWGWQPTATWTGCCGMRCPSAYGACHAIPTAGLHPRPRRSGRHRSRGGRRRGRRARPPTAGHPALGSAAGGRDAAARTAARTDVRPRAALRGRGAGPADFQRDFRSPLGTGSVPTRPTAVTAGSRREAAGPLGVLCRPAGRALARPPARAGVGRSAASRRSLRCPDRPARPPTRSAAGRDGR